MPARASVLLGLFVIANAAVPVVHDKYGLYHYPADDLALLCLSFKSSHREQLTLSELNHQFADDGELTMFRVAQRYLAGAKKHRKYLDIGCGTGRIISTFGGLFEHTTCVEADPARINHARKEYNKWGINRKIDFHNVRFGIEYSSNTTYDAISCMQVRGRTLSSPPRVVLAAPST